jgi:hypothetical protein
MAPEQGGSTPRMSEHIALVKVFFPVWKKRTADSLMSMSPVVKWT